MGDAQARAHTCSGFQKLKLIVLDVGTIIIILLALLLSRAMIATFSAIKFAIMDTLERAQHA